METLWTQISGTSVSKNEIQEVLLHPSNLETSTSSTIPNTKIEQENNI
jgi:hypothetical protein